MTTSDSNSRNEPLEARLARLFGPEVDPHISLSEPHSEGSTSGILQQLLNKDGSQQRYEVRGEIDRGGMGVVLEVWDQDLRRPLAMKVALDSKGDESSGTRRVARFLEEAQITAQLDHPGVVPVHELGVNDEGRVYFTMRRIQGRDLREVLHCVQFGLDGWNETRILSVLLRVCEAVAFAHSRGVIHRDLKPANIMIGAFGEVYVVDWGLAHVLGAGSRQARPNVSEESLSTVLRDERERSPNSTLVTMHGDVLGTPAYMPPEQARGELENPSPRSDVYAIGAMLYHLLAQEPPYFPAKVPTTQIHALKALRQGPPVPLGEVRPGITPELVAICEKAMAYAPEERYADVQALGADLRAFLEQRVVGAYSSSPWAEARQWVRRNRALAGALAAAALLFLLGFVATGSQYLRAEEAAGEAHLEAQRADGEAQVARANLSRAQQSEALALAETEKVLRLSDSKQLEQLIDQADQLWPALPQTLEAMGDWIERTQTLLEQRDLHVSRLSTLRAQARPYDEGMRQRDQREHPQAAELAKTRADMDTLIAGIDRQVGDVREASEERIAQLETHSRELEEKVLERRTWSFENVELQWQHDLLAQLVAGLDELAGRGTTAGVLPQVEARLQFALQIEARSVGDATAQALWADSLEIAQNSKLYSGLELRPQLGLLPLGPDPDSGLLEFSHLASGDVALRGTHGQLELHDATGLVLVLIPAGRFSMGAQAVDAGSPAYDPWALGDEGPAQEVELAAYFLSKYEMTQAQWLRLTGSNPSAYGPHRYSKNWNRSGLPANLMHPVEMVSWAECAHFLPRIDLDMPTECQWERGARAGTTTPWWTGDKLSSLQGAANVADRFGNGNGAGWPGFEAELDDGNTTHAGIGHYRANGFGLHDTAGNVVEWCKDGFGSYATAPAVGDGARPPTFEDSHPRRGGGFSLRATDARSSCRNPGLAGFVSDVLGVRPARALR